MINDEKVLWKQIQDFPLDDPSSTLTFTQRLARENNWSIHFAQRVTTAYKNFIFLCMVSPQAVTPSDAVDQAWHLHMTYTESYWTDLCGKLLGRQLHHHPTKGGENENEKFFYQYDATLLLYQEKFGEQPPEDIWPPAEKRFTAGDFIRVEKDTHWVIKKPRRKNFGAAIGMNVCAAIICLLSGNWAFMVITGLGAIALLMPSDNNTGRSSGCGGGGCGVDSGCGSGCGGGGCGGGGD